MPSRLLITVLHSAVATLPLHVDVNRTAMLIVVGRHVSTSTPSRRGPGSRRGRNLPRPRVNGNPTRNGHAANVTDCIKALSRPFDAALVRSADFSPSPDRRNIDVAPYSPMNSSGRKRPPSLPSSGKDLARDTATTIPIRKKFFDARALAPSKKEEEEEGGDDDPPPRIDAARGGGPRR